MYEKIDNCPLCESGHFHNHLITKDFLVTNESFAIVTCDNCGFKFTNPRPTKNEISKYYESENYISHSNKGSSIINTAYKIARRFTLKSKLSLITKLSSGKKLLDFGCGTGHFLAECEKAGWSCTGVEPDLKAREKASLNKNVNIIDHLDTLENEKYDIITLWHVLEHVHDIDETLASLRRKLTKKSKLLIAVPNCASWDAQNYKEHWAGYDVPRHLYHFEPDTISQFMSKHKMKLKETYPQKLDSYYVSLLSDKNKFNRHRYLRSVRNGILSNINAHKSNMYSSIIYIFSK